MTADEVSPTVFGIIERGRSLSGVEHSTDVEQFRLHSRAIAGDLAAHDVFRCEVINQRDEVVLAADHILIVERRDKPA